MNIQLLEKQISFLQCEDRLAQYRGGIGAGKTFILCFWALLRANAGRKVILLEPTYSMINDVLIPTLEEVAELLGIDVLVHKSNPPKVKVGTGEILLRSAEKPRSIRGINAHDAGIDEASYNKNDEAYMVLIGRLRKAEDAQIRVVGSPNGKDWVFKLAKRAKCPVFIQPTFNNFFLPNSYREDLLKQYSGDFAKQELYGEIVDFSGGIYPTDKVNVSASLGFSGHIVRSWDLAVTTKVNSDFSCGSLCSWDGSRLHIHDVKKQKFEAPTLKELIVNTALRDGNKVKILIEAGGTQQSIYQDLKYDPRLRGFTIKPITPQRSKISRAIPVSALMGHGGLYVKKASWNKSLIEEWQEFSHDDSHEHDDQIDSIAQAYSFMLNLLVGNPFKNPKSVF